MQREREKNETAAGRDAEVPISSYRGFKRPLWLARARRASGVQSKIYSVYVCRTVTAASAAAAFRLAYFPRIMSRLCDGGAYIVRANELVALPTSTTRYAWLLYSRGYIPL